ncbi:MAG: hypothetical protein ACKORC_04935, partial [Acidimicrobiia bacterium]
SGRVVVEQQGTVRVRGEGFAPSSKVRVWVFSDPVAAAELFADVEGRIDAMVEMPSELRVGTHTLQLNGISAKGEVRSLNFGIKLTERTSSPAAAAGSDVASAGPTEAAGGDASWRSASAWSIAAVVALLLVALVALVVARRSRSDRLS